MRWFLRRISENSSKVAIATIIAAGAGIASHTIDPVSASAAILPALLQILVPDQVQTGK